MAKKKAASSEAIRKRLQKRKEARDEPKATKAKAKKTTAKKSTAKAKTAAKKPAAKKTAKKAEASTGKRTHIAAHIDENLKAAVTEIAEAKGTSNSAYLRDLVQRDVSNFARRQTKAGKRLSKAVKAATAD